MEYYIWLLYDRNHDLNQEYNYDSWKGFSEVEKQSLKIKLHSLCVLGMGTDQESPP